MHEKYYSFVWYILIIITLTITLIIIIIVIPFSEIKNTTTLYDYY